MLALINGNAGWAVDGDGVGICHAELKRALDASPGKVYGIDLPRTPNATKRDREFREWIDRHHFFPTRVSTFEGAVEAACTAVVNALATIAKEAGRAPKGRYHSGDALAWSRLGYDERGAQMIEAARTAVLARDGSRDHDGNLIARIGGRDVLLKLHAVPGPMSEPAAKARVGQPFLRDHELEEALQAHPGLAGPVHIVACHRGVTETQASRMLGFPDAVLVKPPFGVWAADPIQKAQLLFLSECRDATATQLAIQSAFEWLDSSGEGDELAERAASRARIVAAIARERQPASKHSS